MSDEWGDFGTSASGQEGCNDENNDHNSSSGGFAGFGGGRGRNQNEGQSEGRVQFGSRGRDRDRERQFGERNGGDMNDGGEPGEERPPPYVPGEVDLDAEESMKVDQGINFDRYDKIKVECKGANITPIDKFSDLIPSELLLGNIEKAGYKKMTPIQRYTIPAMARGIDLIGIAQTGSGKTAAFLLPVLQTILNDRDLDSQYGQECQQPHCIIMAPTRELARQTYVEALKLSKDSIIKCQCIYGGVQTGFLRSQLSKGTHVLVATPGRLKDFINRGWVGLANIKYVILDEGDRLIDDGFAPEMRLLFSNPSMPPVDKRQTMFFSATFNQTAQTIAKEFMKADYLFITVGMVGAANEDVKQEFRRVERAEKKRELKKILQSLSSEDKVIVFTQTKATADILSGFLSAQGIEATSIHGDRLQEQREQALREFKRGTKKCLVASPVGERGLDLPKVSMVINYDLPQALDEYVHRIGRTGRIGNTGRAISFFDPERDTSLIDDLKKALLQAQQDVPTFFNGSGYDTGATGENFDSVAGTMIDANGAAQAEDEAWD